jgi:hypothetical protein
LLGHLKIVTESFPELKIMVLLPIPRYVTGKCCDSSDHITNFDDSSYVAEISDGLERVEELVTGWLQTLPNTGLTVDFRAGTDESGCQLPDQTAGSDSIWDLADPVHPMAALYNSLASAFLLLQWQISARIQREAAAVNGQGSTAWWSARRQAKCDHKAGIWASYRIHRGQTEEAARAVTEAPRTPFVPGAAGLGAQCGRGAGAAASAASAATAADRASGPLESSNFSRLVKKKYIILVMSVWHV